jgi:hypothetical protein
MKSSTKYIISIFGKIHDSWDFTHEYEAKPEISGLEQVVEVEAELKAVKFEEASSDVWVSVASWNCLACQLTII